MRGIGNHMTIFKLKNMETQTIPQPTWQSQMIRKVMELHWSESLGILYGILYIPVLSHSQEIISNWSWNLEVIRRFPKCPACQNLLIVYKFVTCMYLRGVIYTEGTSFGIEPLEGSSSNEHLVYHLEDVETEPLTCGTPHFHNHDEEASLRQPTDSHVHNITFGQRSHLIRVSHSKLSNCTNFRTEN